MPSWCWALFQCHMFFLMASSSRMSDFLNTAVTSHNSNGNLNSVDYFWDGAKLVMQPTNLLDPYDGVTLDHNL